MQKLFMLVSVFAVSLPAFAQTIHVDDNAPAGGAGSVAAPFNSLQAAADAAANGNEIRVAGGTYEPVSVNSKEVQLLGGWNSDFTARGAEVSTIQGTPAGAVVTLYEVGNTILESFVIRGGERGILIDADFLSTTNKPVIRDNTIEQNGSATLVGGGISGIHCEVTITGNTIRNNIASRGPAVGVNCPVIRIEDNVIEGNVAHDDHSGGLYLTGGHATIRRNMIRNNEVGVVIGYGWGGGVVVFGEGTTAAFERNVFTGNRASGGLGAAAFIDDGAVATFSHDLFYANGCGNGAAALYVDGYDTNVSSRATLNQVTIAEHNCPETQGTAASVEAQSTIEFRNSILWNNGGDDFAADATSTITATYTLTQEAISGVGNLSADPLFADPASGDFHVRSSRGRFDTVTQGTVTDQVDSPTMDVGDPAAEFLQEPAPNGGRVNLGHTGNTLEASLSPNGTPAPDGGASSGPAASSGAGTSSGTGASLGTSASGAASGGDGGGACGCRLTEGASSEGSAAAVALFVLMLRQLRRRV